MSKYVHWGWIEIILRAFSEIFGEQMNPADPKIMCNLKHTLKTISIPYGILETLKCHLKHQRRY